MFFIVNINSSYLKRTAVLNPKEEIPDPDKENSNICELYENQKNWQSIRVDGYLGYYQWNENDVDGLKSYIAKKRGLQPQVLEAFPVK